MSKILIQGDNSPIKKSLLEIGSEVKKLGAAGGKVSIFSEKDRKFLKGELGKELSSLKTKLKENNKIIGEMVKEQKKLERGTEKELQLRTKILEAYKTQAKLGKDIGSVQSQSKSLGGIGGVGGSTPSGGMMGGLIKSVVSMAAGAVLGIAGLGVLRGVQASGQYVAGSKSRVKLRGLGGDENLGSAADLARAGLNEQGMIERKNFATSRLGRAAGSSSNILQQARFERSFGLEEGQMTNTAASLRGQMGGQGANEAQMKLQASILASGIEDAIGPYLESATTLLSSINENGLAQTDELISMFADLTKDGARTPEQLARAFQGIDSAVKGVTGEQSAFIQTAFARAGIGGGTIGGTRLAMQSGGITGMSESEMKKQGFDPELMKQMGGAGFFEGPGKRSGALLDQLKKSGGLKKGQGIGDIKDMNSAVGMSSLSNSVFGTKGMDGLLAARMLEKVQNRQMSQKDFEEKLKDLKEGKTPESERLDKINATLAGQTTILTDINTNLMESLGKDTVKARNIMVEGDNTVVQGTKNLTSAIDKTGAVDKTQGAMSTFRDYSVGGKLGEKAYDAYDSAKSWVGGLFSSDVPKKGNVPGAASMSPIEPNMSKQTEELAKAVETGMTRAMSSQKNQPVNNQFTPNIKVISSDGRVTNKTHR